MLERLKELSDHYPEIEILEINHDKDHLHMLASIPPKMAVGKVVGIIKSNTSRRLKEKFPFLKEVYWGTTGRKMPMIFFLTQYRVTRLLEILNSVIPSNNSLNSVF